MVNFSWQGVVYEFDSVECANGDSIVQLPDNSFLRVNNWSESTPPQPTGFTEIHVVLAVKTESDKPSNNNRMVFKYNNQRYEFDSADCCRKDEMIALPNKVLLLVTEGWNMTYPPEPKSVRILKVTQAKGA
jgi:hypothetical protein